MIDIDFVKARLTGLGFETTADDDELLGYIISKVTSEICSYCNITEISEELSHLACDRVCGEYLKSKKSKGDIVLTDKVIKITEGDIGVSFSDKGKTDEQRFDEIIDTLLNGKSDMLSRFRCVSW